MTGMQPIPTEVSEWRLRVANVVHDVFSSFFSSDRLSRTSKNGESGDETTTRGSRGLETSRWAPQNANASANVSKTNASRPNTCVSSGRRLEDSRWAPKQVVQRSRPAVRGLEDSMWASRVDTKKGTEVKVSFFFYLLFISPQALITVLNEPFSLTHCTISGSFFHTQNTGSSLTAWKTGKGPCPQ